MVAVALRKESVDRNIATDAGKRTKKASLSARRAWIEMVHVDVASSVRLQVALRKESVDRNMLWSVLSFWFMSVALRKESVDRNNHRQHQAPHLSGSLSARRAWIEM